MLRDNNRVGVTSNEQVLPPLVTTPAQITDQDLLETLQKQQEEYELKQQQSLHASGAAAQGYSSDVDDGAADRYRYSSAKVTHRTSTMADSGYNGRGGGVKDSSQRYDHDELRGTRRRFGCCCLLQRLY